MLEVKKKNWKSQTEVIWFRQLVSVEKKIGLLGIKWEVSGYGKLPFQERQWPLSIRSQCCEPRKSRSSNKPMEARNWFLSEIYQCLSVASFFNSGQAKLNMSVSIYELSCSSAVHSPHGRQNDFLNTQIRLLKILQCFPISPGIVKLNFMVHAICLMSTFPAIFSVTKYLWLTVLFTISFAGNVITLALCRVSHLCELHSILLSSGHLSNMAFLHDPTSHSLAPSWFYLLPECILIWNTIIYSFTLLLFLEYTLYESGDFAVLTAVASAWFVAQTSSDGFLAIPPQLQIYPTSPLQGLGKLYFSTVSRIPVRCC